MRSGVLPQDGSESDVLASSGHICTPMSGPSSPISRPVWFTDDVAKSRTAAWRAVARAITEAVFPRPHLDVKSARVDFLLDGSLPEAGAQ